MLSHDEFMRRLHRYDLATWLAIMREEPSTQPLPESIDLYQEEVRRWLTAGWLADQPLLHTYLSLPLAIAYNICARRPTFWQELPDFVQRGNLELLLAIQQARPDDATFKVYAAKRIEGVIYGYFAQTHVVYIPPTTRHKRMRKGDEEAFVSFDRMESFDVLLDQVQRESEIDIAAEEGTTQEEAGEKRLLIEQLLMQLPEKERQVLILRYGIDERKHNNTEIGKILGVCPEHVLCLHNQALSRLRGEAKKRAREEMHRQKLERDATMQAVVEAWARQGQYGTIQELMQETGYTWDVAAKFLAVHRKRQASLPISGIPASVLEKLRETETSLKAQGRKVSFQVLQRGSGIDPRYATAYLLREVVQ